MKRVFVTIDRLFDTSPFTWARRQRPVIGAMLIALMLAGGLIVAKELTPCEATYGLDVTIIVNAYETCMANANHNAFYEAGCRMARDQAMAGAWNAYLWCVLWS